MSEPVNVSKLDEVVRDIKDFIRIWLIFVTIAATVFGANIQWSNIRKLNAQQRQIVQRIQVRQPDMKTLQQAITLSKQVKENMDLALVNIENTQKALDFVINANDALQRLKKLGLIDTKQYEQRLLEIRKKLQEFRK